MSEENPSLQDLWKLLGSMNRRLDGVNRRFDEMERQFVAVRQDVGNLRGEFAELKTQMVTGFGVLKSSIEARDFRLDDHGRRISELENSRT